MENELELLNQVTNKLNDIEANIAKIISKLDILLENINKKSKISSHDMRKLECFGGQISKFGDSVLLLSMSADKLGDYAVQNGIPQQ